MTDWEEKTCQLCYVISGLFHRREHMILSGETDKSGIVDDHIRIAISDLKFWLLKNESS